LDLRHLRYFLCVAEEMHFGRAAQRLGISQPPLSQQIRALEDELGTRLFDRTSRRVRLTEAGELFVPEARATLSQADHAIETARLAGRGELGRLRIGFTSSAPFVPLIASTLYRFRENPLADRPDDPTVADLAAIPLVLYAPTLGAGFNEYFFGLCHEAGFEPQIAHEASSFATLLGLVAAGFGATILSRSLERLHLENVVYRRLATPVPSRLWLVHGLSLSPTAEAFRDTIDELRLDAKGQS